MSDTRKTYSLKNSYDTKNLKKIVIDGEIGKITFYGEDLTQEIAQEKYNKRVEKMRVFWEENRDTYFNDHPEDLNMSY